LAVEDAEQNLKQLRTQPAGRPRNHT
jgi:hypothetical protein